MMNIHYLNSKGEKLNLVEWPYRIQTGNIVDFKKSYIYSNSPFSRKILGFDFGVTEKSIVLTISARTKMEYHAALNHFYDVTEHDVMNITPGRLYVNEWYISCFIYGSKKTEWEYGCNFLDNTISLVSDYPYWIKEKKITYVRKEPEPNGYLDYPYDYLYDYTPNDISCVEIQNGEVSPCDFKAVIQGPCTNPAFYIGDQNYQIMTELSSYEYIVLDSLSRTVYKVSRTGRIENVWNSLNKDYDNFAKIPSGSHMLVSYGQFPLELTLYEKRSEPKWT